MAAACSNMALRLISLSRNSASARLLSIAIPASLAKGVMKQIIEHGRVVRGWLGLEAQDLTPALAENLVSGTSLEDKELECVYKGSKDGWSAIDFHKCVDGKGSSLVVGLSRSGQVFGGFNPLGWRSTDDYYNSNAAFLWFAQGDKAEKCPILTGGETILSNPIDHFPCKTTL